MSAGKVIGVGGHSARGRKDQSFIGRRRGGYSLVEVLASLAVFLIGIVGVVAAFPNVLRANDEAILVGVAALLAQEKAAEIRRDNRALSPAETLIDTIAARTAPTQPESFARHPNLMYSFNGRSLLDPVDDADDPDDDAGVARVIVLKNDLNVPPTATNFDDWNILAEYRIGSFTSIPTIPPIEVGP